MTNITGAIRWPLMLKILALIIGFASILGGMVAINTPLEPERYLVAGIVLLFSGACWLLSFGKPQFNFSKRERFFLLLVLLLGLMAGLIVQFSFCGGEYFCHSYRGYPGRWLRISQDMESLNIGWSIDGLSFLANILFWSGLGFTILFVRKFANRNNFTTLAEKIKQI